MTTIATDGKTMAGDGLISGGGIRYTEDFQKLFRLNDGSIVGVCGDTHNHQQFIDWLNGDAEAHGMDGEHAALRLMPDGSVRSYDEKGRWIREAVPTACGSGYALAIGAMEAGATPEQAVHIAARRDTATGGKISVMKI